MRSCICEKARASPRRKVFLHNSTTSLTKLSMFKHWGEWSFTKEKLTDGVLGIEGYHWEVWILIPLIISGLSYFPKEIHVQK